MAKRRARTTRTTRRSRGKLGPRWLGVLLGVLLFLGSSGAWYLHNPGEQPAFPEPLREGAGTILRSVSAILPGASTDDEGRTYYITSIQRVVDGDTIIVRVDGKEERVRLRCVDTPESVHPDPQRNDAFGREASDYTKTRLEGRQIRLVFEDDAPRDPHGRLLAYVLVDGENFNVELVRMGYSEYERKYGRSRFFDRELADAEKDARTARRGLWALKELAAIPGR